jgi:predicted XRE-type DNA-binding protein
MAKLTTADIPQIRAMQGHMTQREIGDLFGVHRATIGDILRGKRWAGACLPESNKDAA